MKAVALVGSLFLMSSCIAATAVQDPSNYLPLLDQSPNERLESFASLQTSHVPSREAALMIASDHWFHKHGYLAEESMTVRGLYRIGRAIPGLAKEGDWVWEVRTTDLSQRLDGVVWVNAQTKNVLSIGAAR